MTVWGDYGASACPVAGGLRLGRRVTAATTRWALSVACMFPSGSGAAERGLASAVAPEPLGNTGPAQRWSSWRFPSFTRVIYALRSMTRQLTGPQFILLCNNWPAYSIPRSGGAFAHYKNRNIASSCFGPPAHPDSPLNKPPHI